MELSGIGSIFTCRDNGNVEAWMPVTSTGMTEGWALPLKSKRHCLPQSLSLSAKNFDPVMPVLVTGIHASTVMLSLRKESEHS